MPMYHPYVVTDLFFSYLHLSLARRHRSVAPVPGTKERALDSSLFMIFLPAACFTAFHEEVTIEKMHIPYTMFWAYGTVMKLEQWPRFCNLHLEAQELLNMKMIRRHYE